MGNPHVCNIDDVTASVRFSECEYDAIIIKTRKQLYYIPPLHTTTLYSIPVAIFQEYKLIYRKGINFIRGIEINFA